MWFGRAISAATLLLIALAGQAPAQTPAEFYKGKDIKMLISHPPGGGYDVYARLFARHVVSNVIEQPADERAAHHRELACNGVQHLNGRGVTSEVTLPSCIDETKVHDLLKIAGGQPMA